MAVLPLKVAFPEWWITLRERDDFTSWPADHRSQLREAVPTHYVAGKNSPFEWESGITKGPKKRMTFCVFCGEHSTNTLSMVQGGAIASLMDYASALFGNYFSGRKAGYGTTASLHVKYLRPAAPCPGFFRLDVQQNEAANHESGKKPRLYVKCELSNGSGKIFAIGKATMVNTGWGKHRGDWATLKGTFKARPPEKPLKEPLKEPEERTRRCLYIAGFSSCLFYQRAKDVATSLDLSLTDLEFLPFPNRKCYREWLFSSKGRSRFQKNWPRAKEHSSSPFIWIEERNGRLSFVGGCDDFIKLKSAKDVYWTDLLQKAKSRL
eukprot:g1286.t1